MIPECLWKLQKWLQIGLENKFTKAWETSDKFLYECISLKREKLSRRKPHVEEEEEFDLLTACMLEQEAEKEDQQQINDLRKSDKFLRDTAFNLLAAGRDTVSSGLTWFFWLIAKHPLVENKIYEEIRANMQTQKDGEKREELNGMVYLHAALCETLRLYPPVAFNHKATAQPDVLPTGHQVNPNIDILISYYTMGRMEEIWGKDCLEFKPERWISEQGRILHIPSHQFPAFGAGPRSCLGKDIAFIQMKMVATAILWNYHFQVAEAHNPNISPRNVVILQMEHGLKVRVFKRHV